MADNRDPTSTVRPEKVGRFNRLAATWRDRAGPLRPLHVVNDLPHGHLLEQVAQRFGRPVDALQALRNADIVCSAGLMCEPLAARGTELAAAACGPAHGERRGMAYLPA
jgi:2-polyprenyl-6-hydroxyphenyl methylase / 3-demethylubiquinone-9 3-methyltransferase